MYLSLTMWLLQKLLVCKLAAWMIEHLYTVVGCLGGGPEAMEAMLLV